ncbi:hypothetical protein BT67DRAFT_443604 [Trichocladium antarcticum]|uniref:Uncharacterized protein n=1 Tax=Trichocladium antarcticum TaxID=1450529 RepID=A0AAN6UHA2_9PEZI|nr:hypothetical protein BT67DRAFT_443604 [Trichocladium antarcticum]
MASSSETRIRSARAQGAVGGVGFVTVIQGLAWNVGRLHESMAWDVLVKPPRYPPATVCLHYHRHAPSAVGCTGPNRCAVLLRLGQI